VAFIRFVVARLNADSGVEDGLFTVAYDLSRSGEISETDRLEIADSLSWLETNVPTPTRFNRSRSKGYYRRTTRGISWIRDTAIEHIARMRELKGIVERHGHVVTSIHEDRVGYVVYEDEIQVVAEPFTSTKTRA